MSNNINDDDDDGGPNIDDDAHDHGKSDDYYTHHMYAVKKDDVENKARGIDAFGVGLGYNVLTLLTYYYNICTKAHSFRHMLKQQENRI